MRYSKITISGKICTGKTSLLQSLQKKLNWPTFQTGQLFRNYVKKHHLNLNTAEEQNTKLTIEVDENVKKMLKNKGNLIVDGWMSGISADDQKNVLRLLLVCNDEIRYKRFAKRENIDIEKAKEMVEERQNIWFSKIKDIHKIDPEEFTNESNYDLVINTSYITPQATLQKVLQKIKE